MLFAFDGKLISPDLLSLSSTRGNSFHEIKAKSKPGYYRKRHRWEHGIDKSLIDQYVGVETKSGIPVWLVIHENLSPPDPVAECTEDELVHSDLWLFLALGKILKVGEHRPTWPGGKYDSRRGRGGLGGWLWPRNEMRQLQITREDAT